jgi:hypothetical protein
LLWILSYRAVPTAKKKRWLQWDLSSTLPAHSFTAFEIRGLKNLTLVTVRCSSRFERISWRDVEKDVMIVICRKLSDSSQNPTPWRLLVALEHVAYEPKLIVLIWERLLCTRNKHGGYIHSTRLGVLTSWLPRTPLRCRISLHGTHFYDMPL